MDFKLKTAQVFVPDGLPAEAALKRTTHLGISAHQDDLEIMAVHGILACYQQKDKWFSGVVVTNGRGSPRAGLYASYTDDEMQAVRAMEQKKVAVIGEYAAQVLLDHPSSAVKDKHNQDVVDDLASVLKLAKPEIIYTHNLADKHETHVGTALKVLAAIRRLPKDVRPAKFYGCEVWRDLDWLGDDEKVTLDVSMHENLQAALLGVFDSQIAGGKRYDLATMGRRKANATYFASHGVDEAAGLVYAMDLTPLIQDDQLSIADYVKATIDRFANEVVSHL